MRSESRTSKWNATQAAYTANTENTANAAKAAKVAFGALAIATGLLASTPSFAEGGMANWFKFSDNGALNQGDVIARVRAISIRPSAYAGGTLAALGTSVRPQIVPELDFTYMVRKHVGVELILGTSRHTVTSNAGRLGGVSVLPPTLTVQWHFNPDGRVRPYAGAGVNYSWFYNDKVTYNGEGVQLKRSSFGPALQAGVDIQVSKRLFVNLDVKKLWMRTDATLGGASIGSLKIDPWIVGVGIGTVF